MYRIKNISVYLHMYVHTMFSSIKVILHVYCICECVIILIFFFFFLLLIEIAEGNKIKAFLIYFIT